MHFHFRERMWCRIPLPASPLLLRSTPLHVPMAPLGLIFLSMKSLKKKQFIILYTMVGFHWLSSAFL